MIVSSPGCVGRTFRSFVFGMLISRLASVGIREFDIVGISILKSETDAPLIVHGNGILPHSFPLQFMKSMTQPQAFLSPGLIARKNQPGKPTASLADDLDQYPLSPPTVELAVEDLLPRAEVELAACDRHHHLPPHHLSLEVRVPVVLPRPVV